MDELVIPAARWDGIVRATVCGCFAAVGLSIIVGGAVIAIGDGAAGGYLLAVVGVVVTALFGLPFAQAVSSLTGHLRLTAVGMQINKRLTAWSDIDGFYPVGGDETGAATHLRIKYRAGAPLDRPNRASIALGRIGYYTAPAYLPVATFDTGGVPLLQILRGWQRGVHDEHAIAERQKAPRPAPRRSRSPGDVVLPPRRAAPAFNAAVALVFFVSIAVLLPWMYADEGQPMPLWLIVAATLLWVMLTAATGYWLYMALRELFSRGLTLHDEGFDVGRMTWLWSDIKGFTAMLVPDSHGTNTVRLGVIYRNGGPPAELPFSPSDFKTDGRQLDQVLHEWLRRSRHRDN